MKNTKSVILTALVLSFTSFQLYASINFEFITTDSISRHFSKPANEHFSQTELYSKLVGRISISSAARSFQRFLEELERQNHHWNYSETNDPAIYKPAYTIERKLDRYGFTIINGNDTHSGIFINKLCLRQGFSVSSKWCFNTLNYSTFSGDGEAVRPLSSDAYELGGGCCWRDWRHVAKINISVGNAMSAEKRYRSVLVLNQHHGSTYFHSVYEVLPRFLYSLPLIDSNPNLMIGITSSAFMTQMVDLFEVNRSRLLYLRNRRREKWIGANMLIYPPAPNMLFQGKDAHIKKTAAILRERVNQKYALSINLRNQLVLVLLERAKTRQDESTDCHEERCLKNFADLKNGLMKAMPMFNTIIYGPTEDIRSTVQTFSLASVVVGVHGAGLQNQMFCETGTIIVEIGYGPDLYEAQAKTFGHVYHQLFVDGLSHRSRNFILPELNKTVEQISEFVFKKFKISRPVINGDAQKRG